MARTVREARLETRAARLRLPARPEPYWRVITEGAHLGYYRGKRGGKWVARFRKPGAGSGYSKATLAEADDIEDADGERFLDYRQAQERARTWFEKVAAGTAQRGSYTVAHVLDEYMASFRGRSIVATRSRINAILKPDLGALEVRSLTAQQIREWHDRRAKSPARLRTGKLATQINYRPVEGPDAERRRRSTANRDLTVLKAALNRAAEHHTDLPVHAWRSVKPFPNVDGAKLRYLSDEEARRLVNASDQVFRPLVQAALLTGARYGELAAIQVREFDAAAGTVRLTRTKSGVPRIAYLEEEGSRLFERLVAGRRPDDHIFCGPNGKRWGASHQARPLAAACLRAGLETLTFHDLRRTYGARLARRGVPMAVIAEALGHADERITRRHYAHLSPSYVADTVRANIAGLGIVSPNRAISSISKARNRG